MAEVMKIEKNHVSGIKCDQFHEIGKKSWGRGDIDKDSFIGKVQAYGYSIRCHDLSSDCRVYRLCE
jgi:hypothetical protein